MPDGDSLTSVLFEHRYLKMNFTVKFCSMLKYDFHKIKIILNNNQAGCAELLRSATGYGTY
jgi:hypothetical protein